MNSYLVTISKGVKKRYVLVWGSETEEKAEKLLREYGELKPGEEIKAVVLLELHDPDYFPEDEEDDGRLDKQTGAIRTDSRVGSIRAPHGRETDAK